MLPEPMKELISAAVDGELSTLEQQALRRLLIESTEAQELYKNLSRTSERLRNLPRSALPNHFSSDVLLGIHNRAPQLIIRRPEQWTRSAGTWANIVAAVAVMICVAVGSFAVMYLRDGEIEAERMAGQGTTKPALSSPVPTIRATPTTTAPAATPVEPERITVRPREVISEPQVANSQSDLLATPFNPKQDLFTVEPAKLPPIVPVRDLDQPANRAKLLASLASHEMLQLDLFVRDSAKGLDHVLAALRGRSVTIEALAQERYKLRVKTFYAIYTESMSVQELTKVLASLAPESRRDGTVDKLVVKPMNGDGPRLLSVLLGVDSKWLLSKPNGPAAIDPTKPISDGTADKIAQSIATKGGRGGEHYSAIVMSASPIRPNPGQSREVQAFLAGRKDRKSNSVPTLLIIRMAD